MQAVDELCRTAIWPLLGSCDALGAAAPNGQERRVIIGIAGMPGSGKSVLASKIIESINNICPGTAILVGMDGWHYSRAALDRFPDPKEAHARRGAAFTFDAASFATFVAKLRSSGTSSSGSIFGPTFDHCTKDPQENGVEVLPQHKLVIIEGIYVGMDDESWKEAARMMDERWWIQADDGVLVQRLAKRHVETGVTIDTRTAVERALVNDLPNGRDALAQSLRFDRMIDSMGWRFVTQEDQCPKQTKDASHAAVPPLHHSQGSKVTA